MNQQGQQGQQDKDAFKNKDITVERAGTKIMLPAAPREMTYDEGIQALQRIRDQENILVNINEEVDAFPLEGAWALTHVIKAKFGYVLQTEFEFMGMKMPTSTMVNLETGFGKSEQVIWGQVQMPGVEGKLETGISRTNNGQLQFCLKGQIKKSGQHIVKEVADAVRLYVKEHSLYKGKAFKITTRQDESGRYVADLTTAPKFLDLTRVNEEELTFSDDVKAQVETSLFTPITHTELCRENGVPLKRAVLLEGPYGTGKTLTAFVTAKKAEENGWTFIYLDRVQGLKDTLIFARRYAPCAIFAEDIERVVSGDRSTEVDDVLNNIDGIDSKNQEVLCIFTTNHVEKLNKAMLRAGRLDAIITVLPPDQKAAEKLVRIYSKGLIGPDVDLKSACKELAGQIPAFIREAVERAKLYAISKLKKGEKLTLSSDDIKYAAVGMKRHLELASARKQKPLSTGERLEHAISEILQRTGTGNYSYDHNGHVTASVETALLAEAEEATVQ